jgi:sugar phosphate isomerase/epimerase
MQDFLFDISSINFHIPERQQLLDSFRAKAEELGVNWGVQLHNDENQETIDFLFENKIPMTGHSPLLEKYNWNFAAADISSLWEGIENNVKLFEKTGITRSCFHGFYMSDRMVEAFGHGKTYGECMAPLFRDELTLFPGNFRNRDFTNEKEYLMRRERVKNNLHLLKARFPQIEWSIENDFPAYGAGSMRGRDMNELDFPLCLDTGHLWCMCHLLDLDFHEETEKFLEGGRVKMIHLHASIYTDDTPKEEFRDGHRVLSTPNTMDLPRFVRTCARSGVRHFVLEIFNSTPEDLELVVQWLRS